MKCFLINLDKRSDRMRHMARILADAGISFERVPAVDGQHISDKDFKSNVLERPDRRRAVTRGEYACMQSHRLCFEKIVSGEDEYAIVLEDDIHLAVGAEAVLASSAWIPRDVDIVKFETGTFTGNRPRSVELSKRRIDIGNGFKLAKLHTKHLGTAGYIISRSCAAAMLDRTGIFEEAIDVLMFDPVRGHASEFNIHQITPALCIQDNHLSNRMHAELSSDLASQRKVPKVSRKRRGLAKLRHEVSRPFRRGFHFVYARCRRVVLEALFDRSLEVVPITVKELP